MIVPKSQRRPTSGPAAMAIPVPPGLPQPAAMSASSAPQPLAGPANGPPPSGIPSVGQLPVVETFHSLQGEGLHAGRSAFFLRLAGCAVGCSW